MRILRDPLFLLFFISKGENILFEEKRKEVGCNFGMFFGVNFSVLRKSDVFCWHFSLLGNLFE